MFRDKLAFLDRALGSRKDFYRESKWLISDFDDNVWEFKTESSRTGNFQVDFNIRLSNGSLLTDIKNKRLLNTFKYWINAAVHPDNTRGRGFAYADNTAKNIITKVLVSIDYFLLNDRQLNISTCGLQSITEDYLRQFSDRIITNKSTAEHVYDWTRCFSDLLTNQITSANKERLLSVANKVDADIEAISDEQLESNKLNIPIDQIPLARCWLWENGYYRRAGHGDYKYVVNTKRLAKALFGETTLWGAAGHKPQHEILSLGVLGTYKREYSRVPVRRENDEISYSHISLYRSALGALPLLRDEVLSDECLLLPPIDVINAFQDYCPDNIKQSRFVTLPSAVVLTSVRNAIEFHFKYADTLIISLKNILHLLAKKRAHINAGSRDSLAKVMTQQEFVDQLHPTIRELGITKWSLDKLGHARHKALRNNIALCELIRVYYGCTQVVVGALMARRQSELVSLKAINCLDTTSRYLVFGKAKSSRLLEGRRVDVARPIDEIAAEMIKKLISFQDAYLAQGYIKRLENLFDTVSPHDASSLIDVTKHPQSYDESLDYFCDYFETPLRNGNRFYIRTHQLRRFFALSFFWGSGFGGMDTLRWFMGHTDPEHLYHYITENSPGEVLRHAKSQFLSETIDEHLELRALISERYGTSDFTLLNTDELEDYIDGLILDGEVDVEPEFIEDDRGKSYKLLVSIKRRNNAG